MNISTQVRINDAAFYDFSDTDGILRHAWAQLQHELNNKVISVLGEEPHTIRVRREMRRDLTTMDTILRMTAEVMEVETMKVVMPEVIWGGMGIIDNKKTRCRYCGQVSPDDERGGCAACGGRR